MNEQHSHPLAQIISAIGQPHFAEVTSHALCRMADFQLSSVVLHHSRSRPQLVFDGLSPVGYGTGIDNYIRFTHPTNPMLKGEGSEGAFRASDFPLNESPLRADLMTYLLPAPEEELGFRTVGWPERLEELGLFFQACGGMIEFSLYRERGRKVAPAQVLRTLNGMRAPLAAAFERHDHIRRPTNAAQLPPLTKREHEIAELLLTGCSSDAIALRLGIGRYTVKDHRKEIFRKLSIGSLAELFALANPRS